jgi:hypothetical protein
VVGGVALDGACLRVLLARRSVTRGSTRDKSKAAETAHCPLAVGQHIPLVTAVTDVTATAGWVVGGEKWGRRRRGTPRSAGLM